MPGSLQGARQHQRAAQRCCTPAAAQQPNQSSEEEEELPLPLGTCIHEGSRRCPGERISCADGGCRHAKRMAGDTFGRAGPRLDVHVGGAPLCPSMHCSQLVPANCVLTASADDSTAPTPPHTPTRAYPP